MWWRRPLPATDCHRVIVATNHMREPGHMQITMLGLDIAKNVFQVHGINSNEKIVVRKQLRRGQIVRFVEELPLG